ncbi:VC0807 family protein [Bacillus sp. SD088]|uniref:VC0807 family protein n=1 Tax=Bacillus sp. SD088 TaxID=2782012 RepID=UPI001F60B4E0|nr:VC0807 family protein [Bacillus sp. SD088]
MLKKTRNEVIVTILLNIALPYLTYRLLIPYTSGVVALTVAALLPLSDTLINLIKNKKIDAVSSFIFLSIILGIVAVLIGGNEKFILLRESYIIGIMGMVFLISLFFTKPLIYYFAIRFAGGKASAEEKWANLPAFRKNVHFLTVSWGIILLLEAVVKVILVYSISVSAFLLIAPFFTYGIIGLGILWNIQFIKRVRNKSVVSS